MINFRRNKTGNPDDVFFLTFLTINRNPWTFDYDENGNMIERKLMGVVDFHATFDELNRLSGYRFSDAGNYNEIEYDGIGRVWERTDTSSNETFFYHTGSKLAQELDDSYDVTVDYMAGSRRYMPGEADEDKYRYYAKDHLGSVVMMSDRSDGSAPLDMEYYTYDSWGEHADTATLPTVENNIRYAGGRVECFVDANSQCAVYLCGERHYMPKYGRFLQRDRLTYEKLPSPTNPLSVNPYIYAYNNPVMYKDTDGLAPSGYYRGAIMTGRGSMFLGTTPPPGDQVYDCCDKGYNSLSHAEIFTSQLHNTKLGGSRPLAWWFKQAGWNVGEGLCQADPYEGQPNDQCAATTTASPDLLCTYLEKCKGLTCPDWKAPDECPTGTGNSNIYTWDDLTDKEMHEGWYKSTWDQAGIAYPFQGSTSNPDAFEQAWAGNRPENWRFWSETFPLAVAGIAAAGIVATYAAANLMAYEVFLSGSNYLSASGTYYSIVGAPVSVLGDAFFLALAGPIVFGGGYVVAKCAAPAAIWWATWGETAIYLSEYWEWPPR